MPENRAARATRLLLVLLAAIGGRSTSAQGTQQDAVVSFPHVIRVDGALTVLSHAIGPVPMTLSLYESEAAELPLWREARVVHVRSDGRYTVYIGDRLEAGLPVTAFTSGRARWLGVQVGAEPELPRQPLTSQPYAISAEDAHRLGGRLASEFVLVDDIQSRVGRRRLGLNGSEGVGVDPPTVTCDGPCTPGHLVRFGKNTTVHNSSLFQLKSGEVGIGTSAPSSTLTVNGVVESIAGGFRFPDGSVQPSASTATGPAVEGSASVSVSVSGSGDTSADDINFVTLTLPAAARVMLFFTGSLSFSSTVQNRLVSHAFNVDNGASLIGSVSFQPFPWTSMAAAVPASAMAVTEPLPAGVHTFRMRVSIGGFPSPFTGSVFGRLNAVMLR